NGRITATGPRDVADGAAFNRTQVSARRSDEQRKEGSCMRQCPALERVRAALRRHGVNTEILEFPQGTRTARDAAEAIGTAVGQIVKSLVFVAGDEPVLILVSGAHLADTEKLGRLLGTPVQRADADVVRQATGFA